MLKLSGLAKSIYIHHLILDIFSTTKNPEIEL